MNLRYIFLFLLPIGWGCKKEIATSSFNNNLFTAFSFRSINNPKIPIDIIAEISDSTVTCALPIGISPDSLIASFQTNALVTDVSINAVKQLSGLTMNNFIQPNTYTLRGRDNSIRNYHISVKPFTGLPIVYLYTDGNAPITSKDDYVTGRISIHSNYTGFANYDSTMQIKLRGNYSITLPKKPYKIKLTAKASILGMPEDKEWALLANYNDKTLMRNLLAFKISEIFSLPYTPRSTFAEVFLNGAYQGNYQVCETIKIATSRVNIKSMAATDLTGDKLTGGYLFEVDSRLDGTDTFVTKRNIGIVIHDPEFEQPLQINYLKNYVQQLEDVLYSSDFNNPVTGYTKYLNPSSAIKWFWVNEIARNPDANMTSSVYMYKERSSIINIGPVWDFDLGFGNNNVRLPTSTQGWYVRNAPWFSQLFHDTTFTRSAIADWHAVRNRLDSLSAFIDATAFNLKYSEAKDDEVWNALNLYVWPENLVAGGTFPGEVAYLKNWLSARIQWIDANLSSLQN